MSLSSRLSLFFLGALAAVLLGFSGTLYVLGRSYLTRQLDEHLEKALDTLEAAVDVETDGLEWEPQDRRLTLGMDPGVEHVRWAVQAGNGDLVDRSPNVRGADFPPGPLTGVFPEVFGDATARGEVPGWRLARRHLRLPELQRLGKGHPRDDGPDDDVEYAELILTVGLSPAPVEAGLQRLALALAGVSTALWLLCAALGRWLCRRALIPVVQMAEAAREMTTADEPGGLPSPGTGDELEDLGRAFNDLLARRHEALERQRRFAGDASHQLRTPLAGLLSLVEVIRRRPRAAEEYERALDQVHGEATRLRQIVDSLLFLARAEAEATPPEGEPIDLTAWTAAQLRRWSGHPRASDLRLEEPDHPVWLRASPALLAPVLENLLDNALKYSEPGTPVAVACRREEGQSALAVEDRGCGLSPEEVPSIFEPFYRAPRSHRLGRAGVGLGLSVVQRIVTASGGTIAVETAPGRGTRFVLRFPACEPPMASPAPPSPPALQPAGR
ncbi:sensor histidine kinase [Aquisphaera insulae]|uniref:sensor histidine kinase n=1 Tax=Aquisphaera insulae TaxID=2712864 RepID=UPI0013ED10E7|nr:ATP-binding protein [Aquisphaera insulae]